MIGLPASYHFKNHQTISELQDAWQKLTVNQSQPFINFHFLHALEITGCITAQAGWYPYHLAIYDADENITALMPLYVKMNSYGEYVFDHAWAHAWQQAGGEYYPKLLSAIPFTPISGERILHNAHHPQQIQQQALASLQQLTQQHNFSSAHINFLPQSYLPILKQQGFSLRQDTQFHWHNQDYQTFDDFLNQLSSRKRKNIRKERQKIRDANIEFRHLRGQDIGAQDWDYFYRFYADTYQRKWGVPYLTRGFFDEISHRMAENILLVIAYHNSKPIAGALNFCDAHHLYGRNWGCHASFDFLHFETCYYQAIDYAIAHKISTVEAGTQGQHKLDRGYVPVPTYSAHYFPHKEFHQAVKNFNQAEGEMQKEMFEALQNHSPFKKSD